MTWYINEVIETQAAKEKNSGECSHWCAVWSEVTLLNNQRCIYCSGFGHSGKDCPTDAKLRNLRGGVAAQNKALARARKDVRLKFNMAAVRSFSLLSPYKRPANLATRGPGKKKVKIKAEDDGD